MYSFGGSFGHLANGVGGLLAAEAKQVYEVVKRLDTYRNRKCTYRILNVTVEKHVVVCFAPYDYSVVAW